MSELAQRYQLHPTQVSTWKREYLNGAEQVLTDGPVVDAKAHEQEKARLHRQIGKLTVSVNWLKRTSRNVPRTAKSLDRSRPEGDAHRAAMRCIGDPPQRLLLNTQAVVRGGLADHALDG